MLFHVPQRRVTYPSYPSIFIDHVNIEYVNEFNFLGLMLDQHLNWKPHINMVSMKISKTIGIMYRLKNIFPKQAMLNIYNALVLSYLNYGLIVWGKNSEKLFKLQKRAIRVINAARYNAHTSVLFKNDNILKLRDMCALHDFKFCYKFMHGDLPEYFLSNLSVEGVNHAYATRRIGQLRVPAVRHDFARNGIKYRLPVIYNNMPLAVKEKIYTHSAQGFRYYVKTMVTQSYSTVCSIENCYVCLNY